MTAVELCRSPFQEARELSPTLLLLCTFAWKLTDYCRSVRQATSIFLFHDSLRGRTSAENLRAMRGKPI
jgi:hypothetical protein